MSLTLFDYLYMAAFNALRPTTIIFAAVIGVIATRWKWAITAAVVFSVLEFLALTGFAIMIFGGGWSLGPWNTEARIVSAVDRGSTLLAYIGWVTIFYLMKRAAKPWFMRLPRFK